MKKLISIFTAGAALICALLSTSGCTCTPPVPVTLETAELESAADTLYNKLCQSGVLDRIAAANEDAEEDELPTVEYDRMITNQCKNRGNANMYALVTRFVEKLQNGGHMVVMDTSRTGIESGVEVGVDGIIEDNYENGSPDSVASATSGQDGADYHVKGEIFDNEKFTEDGKVVRYTIKIHLTKPTEKGTRQLWTGTVCIEKLQEF